ncbi:MAG: hypothetical protein FGM15_11575 [Chthoniobacterales bacterium]|nr:hypothetical protein [Chthoniobacterales bacterium]
MSLVLLALSLWGARIASRQTEYLPTDDVLTYTIKAANVWAELRQGNFRGLMGIEPTVRPFGTSLLGYPLGYDDDFRAFYWRTVAMPVCFAILGALFAAMAAGARWKSPSAWLAACLCGMMPMWWTFDPVRADGLGAWGMMDGMQGGVAALSTGLLLLGWSRNRAAITLAGFFFSAFTLLLKPVGVFLMAGQALAAVCLWFSSRWGDAPKPNRRFAAGAVAGIVWCVLVGAACYFSPYFSEENLEMGRQSVESMRSPRIAADPLANLAGKVPLLAVSGFGVTSLLLWAGAFVRMRRPKENRSWTTVVPAVALLVFLLQLIALYFGTRFVFARYFVPALATFSVFLAPLLWLLLRQSRLARLLVVLNAVVLCISVWRPDFARDWHHITGYATFNNRMAVSLAGLARSAVDKIDPLPEQPIVYLLPRSGPGKHRMATVLERHLAHFGGWEKKMAWPYQPSKNAAFVHPHEMAVADFLLTTPRGLSIMSETARSKINAFYDSGAGDAFVPPLVEADGFAIRRITDPIALEKALFAWFVEQGLVHPQESGPVPVEAPQATPLARWTSGDELLSIQAEWVDEKLRVISTWTGTRKNKRDLEYTFALLDSSGVPLRWITGSLLPASVAQDGTRHQRTFVDDLDCGQFSQKTAQLSVEIYDRHAKSMIPRASSEPPERSQRIIVPITDSTP